MSYNGSLGVLTHGADGSDRLQGIETLQFTDTTIAASAVATFDGLAYIASYGDLIAAFGLNAQSGFDHYVGDGFAGGRSISFDPLRRAALPASRSRMPGHAVPPVASSYCCNRDAGAANSAVLSVRARGRAGNSSHAVH